MTHNNTTGTTGGSKAKAGIYWSKGTWNLTTLSGDGGVLPGGPTTRYVRIPTLAFLVFAPLMGASYVVFLPFIGFAMLADYGAKKAAAGAKGGMAHLAMVMSPEWRPGEAYFLGRRRKGTKTTAKGKGTGEASELDRLEKKIEAKRDGKK